MGDGSAGEVILDDFAAPGADNLEHGRVPFFWAVGKRKGAARAGVGPEALGRPASKTRPNRADCFGVASSDWRRRSFRGFRSPNLPNAVKIKCRE